MNFVQFPDIIPSSMDFVAPRFPVGSDTSLGGVSSRRKFGNRQYDGRLTVEFRNISNYLCAQVLLTCINSKGLAPIAFYESFFRGAGDDLKLFLDGSAYPGLLWYFIEDSPPRINRVEGGAEVSNMSMELAARLMPDSTGSSTTPILPAPLPTPGGPGGGTVQPTQYVTSVSAEAPLSSTGGADPVLSLPMATQTADGGMSKNDKLKLDNIEVGAQPNVPTNLAYTPSTRLLASSTGDDVTLPLFSSANAGLTPSSGGGTANFLRADGTWAQPPGVPLQTRTIFSATTQSFSNLDTVSIDLDIFQSYAILLIQLSHPSRCRIYTDNTSRANDAPRSIGSDPTPGSGLIVEVVSAVNDHVQKITPFVIGGNLDSPPSAKSYMSITNLSGSARVIVVSLTVLRLEL